MSIRVEQVTGAVAFHGEGPVWSHQWGGLRWVDMFAGDVLSLTSGGEVERQHVGRVAAALRPRLDGGAVIAAERGFVLEAPDGTLTTLAELWSDPDIRMNEGACDPQGRFYCGSMAYDQRPGAGTLFRLHADGSVERVIERVTISNGLDWSPDGRLAYYADTATGRIDVFAYGSDSGFHSRRALTAIDSRVGYPDGLTVDAEGGVWVAVYAGGEVRRYGPDGKLDAVVPVPVSRPTACTFGPDRQLFITTTREGLGDHEEPLAGSLFVANVGVSGQTTRPFWG